MENAAYGTETNVSGIATEDNAPPPRLAILATGISGNARLHERLGTAEALRAVDRCMKRIERAVDVFGGRILKAGERELIAAFDSTESALHAAVEMQQRVADLPPVSGVKMAVRIGVSCAQIRTEAAVNEAAGLAVQAKPGRILALPGSADNAWSTLLQTLGVAVEPLTVTLSGDAQSVLEIAAPEATNPPASAVSGARKQEPSFPSRGCLRLQYRGETVLLNDSKTLIRIGRDARSDVLIRDAKASRHHAVIEQRDDLVVLVDHSTNGTYVAIEGMPEKFLRQGEYILRHRGQIAFAASSAAPEADIAEFELT